LPVVVPLLSLTEGLPEQAFAPGDVVIVEGERTGAVWILVSGSVLVRRGDEVIASNDRPGSMFGEISLLLGQPHNATVVATEATTMRYVEAGEALFERHPDLARIVATDLARRLDTLTIYLADVQRQYGAAPGLSMVKQVLMNLADQATTSDSPRPVSARDPDPEF
jgi:CRP/FNR family cyclic AMP-dependent transcriptional regulator